MEQMTMDEFRNHCRGNSDSFIENSDDDFTFKISCQKCKSINCFLAIKDGGEYSYSSYTSGYDSTTILFKCRNCGNAKITGDKQHEFINRSVRVIG